MEQITPVNSDQPTVQQMFATLLGEIASLRKQNEEQQRQLEQLRGDMSLFLQQPVNPLQSSRKPQFKHLPLEIREAIWELTVPMRLLRFEGVRDEKHVPSALSVPTVAHVCQESRHVVICRKDLIALSGRSNHPRSPSQLWRLTYKNSAGWTWFSPSKDALFINAGNFMPTQRYHSNQGLVDAAEHVVVEASPLWTQFGDIEDGEAAMLRDQLVNWLREVPPLRAKSPSTRDPSFNLRTIDFAMDTASDIDQNFPPNFVRRLFDGHNVRIVDLRDKETVREIEDMYAHELCKVTDSHNLPEWPSALAESLGTYHRNAGFLFPHVRESLLTVLAGTYHKASQVGHQTTSATLPSPFKGDGKLDMKVTWVEQLVKHVDIRPVHVFVRAGGTASTGW